jgi:hypothetical protein
MFVESIKDLSHNWGVGVWIINLAEMYARFVSTSISTHEVKCLQCASCIMGACEYIFALL